MTADPRARWAEHLSVPADAPNDVALAQFLHGLPGDDFLPPPERVAAVNALAGAALPTGTDPAVEQMLRDEVEALADTYWKLEPAERLTTWAELSRRGAAAARLRELEPGLDVPVTQLTDPVAEELAALFRTLFVLPPRERAIRRNTWLVENATNMGQWRAALKVVLRDAPSLVTLDAQLYAALGRADNLDALVADEAIPSTPGSVTLDAQHYVAPGHTIDQDAVAPAGRRYSIDVDDALRKREYELIREFERARREPEPEPQERAEPSARPIYIFGLILCGLLVCTGLFGRGNRQSGSSVAPQTPAIKLPPVHTSQSYLPPPKAGRPLPFTPAEIAECEQYEREKAAGRNPRQPAIYSTWELMGRLGGAPDTKLAPATPLIFSFDAALIRACHEYDQRKTGSKPVFYEFWVKAGKPTKPGDYPITTDPN